MADLNFCPFTGKRWLKGNLHIHTNRSDGVLEPAMVAEMYKRNNYDFVSITDHKVYNEYFNLCDEDFLVIPGGEFSVNPRGEERTADNPLSSYHIVQILANPDAPGRLPSGLVFDEEQSAPLTFDQRVQKTVDWGDACGNIVIMAHPNSSRQFEHSAKDIRGFTALEVYNTSTEVSKGHGNSEQHWDYLLRNGVKIWAVASDDYHRGAGLAGGWIMVSADELTIPSIAKAIRDGSFYSTTGPRFLDLRAEDGEIAVKCTPCYRVRFVQYDHRGRIFNASGGRDSITEARFPYHPGTKYVRVELVTTDGKKAWSNPIFINEVGPAEGTPEIVERTDPKNEICALSFDKRIATDVGQYFTERTPLRHGNFYKGCLHLHTTRSDGRAAPEEICAVYKAGGYSFLSLTDHQIYTNTDKYDSDGFIVLPGVEVGIACGTYDFYNTPETRNYTYHINGILGDYSKDANPLPDGFIVERPHWTEEWVAEKPLRAHVQETIDFLKAHGNLVMMNHPKWSVNFETDVYGFTGLFAMETYNHATEQGNGNGYSEHYYEYCLRNRMDIWQTATDDAHLIASACGGWVTVSAPELTKQAIADALRMGHFYSSNGPEIYDFYVDENGFARISCSEAKEIRFMTVEGGSYVMHASSSPLTKAKYRVAGTVVWARVEGPKNTFAWTNPIRI